VLLCDEFMDMVTVALMNYSKTIAAGFSFSFKRQHVGKLSHKSRTFLCIFLNPESASSAA